MSQAMSARILADTVPELSTARPPSASLFLFMLPLCVQAWCLHPDVCKSQASRIIRLALVPVTAYLALVGVRKGLAEPKEVNVGLNFALSNIGPFGVMKALEFGLVQGPYRWIGLDGDDRQPNGQPNDQKTRSSWLERLSWTLSLVTRYLLFRFFWLLTDNRAERRLAAQEV
jgi:hypothetical protein